MRPTRAIGGEVIRNRRRPHLQRLIRQPQNSVVVHLSNERDEAIGSSSLELDGAGNKTEDQYGLKKTPCRRPVRNEFSCHFQCSDSPGFSGTPGSSKTCTAVAGPRSAQSCSTHATFLSGVTSTSCGPLPFPPREQMIVLPFASRVQLCVSIKRYGSGKSPGRTSQTVSPFGLTSRVSLSLSSVINVLPFFNRTAAQGEQMRYRQISLKCLSYSTTAPLVPIPSIGNR